MSYGQGAFIEGAVQGYRQYERDKEQQVDREENRQVRALNRRALEGQVQDAEEVRGRRRAYESDPEVTGATDATSYYRARRDRARQMGDTAEFERATAKLMEAEKRAFDADYERSMRRFITSKGADYKGLVDTYNKHWSDGVTLDMVRNEDGSYDMTFSREGEEPTTTRAGTWEEVGRVAAGMADPKAWAAMKDAEYKELLRRETDLKKIEATGDQQRRTVAARGEQARETAKLRQTNGGGIAGDPAAVRTAKWQIKQLTSATNPATGKPYTEGEATALVLKADRGDVTAKDRLRHLGVLRRGQMPGDTTPLGPQLQQDVDTARGATPGAAPAPANNDPLGLRK